MHARGRKTEIRSIGIAAVGQTRDDGLEKHFGYRRTPTKRGVEEAVGRRAHAIHQCGNY